MKFLCTFLIVASTFLMADKNAPVTKVDLKKFSGTWYSLYSIPTLFDKGSRETTTTYTLNKDGFYNVITTYKKPGDNKIYFTTSKIFPGDKQEESAMMKVQFIWPIKLDYWVIELADDYSYVVVGHPDHKFLFIMSRNTKMPKKNYEDIVERCRAKGYDVDRLTSQLHDK